MAGKTRRILHSVGRELKENPPRQLAKTRKKFGAKRADKQRIAILLSKARKRGASVKRRSK
jgi:hypothetical protein